MTESEFESLVRRYEAFADRHPKLHRLRVASMAAGAYLYLLGLIAFLLAAGAGIAVVAAKGHALAALKLLVPILFVLGIVVRALWVRLEAPHGAVVTPSEFPELFEMIETVRRAVKAPSPNVVRIDGEINASITQIPRLGFFGWHRNHLTLGLPLMRLLPPDEFRAVVAHEFAHLSRAHGVVGAWLFRVRATWARIVEDVEKERRGDWAVSSFFKWFSPRFSAASFVLARQHEYEADRLAAEAVGTGPAAGALVRIRLAGHFVDAVHWPRMTASVGRSPEPPQSPFAALGASVPYERTEDLRTTLAAALEVGTGVADTHPSLADRLRALGAEPDPPPAPEATADLAFLGSRLDSIEAVVSTAWRYSVTSWWTDRHERYREGVARLEDLDARRSSGDLPIQDAFRHATLVEEFRGPDAALPLYQALLAREGALAGPNGAVGRILLARGDASGVDYFERAIESDPDGTPFVARAVSEFFRARGRHADAEAWRRRGERCEAELEAARDERSELRKADTLEPHDLAPADVAALVGRLRDYRKLKRAWLARKRLAHFPERPMWILVVAVGGPATWIDREKKAAALVGEIARDVEFPGEALVVPLTSANRFLRKMLRKAAVPRIL